MASLLSPRRSRSDITLRATEPRAAASVAAGDQPTPSRVRWILAAVLAGIGAAGVGWVLVVGVCVLGWVADGPGTLTTAVATGTSLWLLAHGAGIRIGALSMTLVPWGATAVFAFVLFRGAAFAGRQARAGGHPAGVAAIITAAYLTPVVAATVLLGGPAVLGRGAVAVPVTLAAVALWGCARGFGRPVVGVGWLRSLALGVLAAVLVLVAGGAAALVWSLIDHLDRVVQLTAALDPGVSGGIALVVAQLAFAPDAAVWAASYALGSGFVLGEQTLVAPASTALGLLPGVPLFGGLPDPGPGSPWALGWLALGATAGAVAALPVVRTRRADGFAASTLAGGLAGVAAAGVFVALAWAVGGDLGAARLAGVGPRLLPLLVLAGSTLGLAGMAAGLAARSLRGRLVRRGR